MASRDGDDSRHFPAITTTSCGTDWAWTLRSAASRRGSIVATLLLASLVAATNGLLRSDWTVAVVAAVMAVVHAGVLYLLVHTIRERRRES